jgi:hypothetical protein
MPTTSASMTVRDAARESLSKRIMSPSGYHCLNVCVCFTKTLALRPWIMMRGTGRTADQKFWPVLQFLAFLNPYFEGSVFRGAWQNDFFRIKRPTSSRHTMPSRPEKRNRSEVSAANDEAWRTRWTFCVTTPTFGTPQFVAGDQHVPQRRNQNI